MHDIVPKILIFTQHGVALARRIAASLDGPAQILAPAKAFDGCPSAAGIDLYDEPAAQRVAALFRAGHPLVAIASVGLMVRLVAGYIRNKAVDPPVVVVDEAGRFVVPVLSGHLGGANALAERLAAHLGAVAVVTTATEALGTLSIDRVAAEAGWRIEDLDAVKAVTRCLVHEEPVVVVQECGDTGWQQAFGPLPESIALFECWDDVAPGPGQQRSQQYKAGILISDRCIPSDEMQAVAPSWAVCRPPSLVVGVGAEKDVPPAELHAAVQQVLAASGFAVDSVSTIATLDRKASEEGFGTWLTQQSWPVVTYAAAQLAQVQGIPNPSDIVAQTVGTPGVCEPAALLASGSTTLLVPKQKCGRVTVAVARQAAALDPQPPPWSPLPSPEEMVWVRGEEAPMASTPTPALSLTGRGRSESLPTNESPTLERDQPGGDEETVSPSPTSLLSHQVSPQRGRLTIIGIGPGAADLLTVRALDALERCEVLVGYERYIQLLGDRAAGKEIHGSAIGHESDRARLAIDLARQGREVALISSGDAGIYGMAGLAFEHLERQGWSPGTAPDVEVIPGVSAAQTAAALLGAPLSNDFAVLSLSDLLTPRATIERRLEALAAADLVVALYNPQSQKRRALFQQACEIFLRHRPATTPVGVVRAASREGQAIHLTDLGQLQNAPVDMESLVLIGNSQTRRFADRLVTARGYLAERTSEGEAQGQPGASAYEEGDPGQVTRKIRFIGAGPGDPELLTLRGARALATADVVVYAGSLVPRGVLTHIRPGARVRNSAALTLEETHRLLTEAYRAGQQVVRLHSGDPSLYGAITEQMARLDAEHIPYEIVPGVSAFQAVAARLGIEYTQPGVVQTLILTRAGGRTGLPPNESLAELARHQVTLCLFLSARHVAEVQETLLTSYPPTTPVAVAYRATWPDEELLSGTLEELTAMLQSQGHERTVLIVVGPSLRRQGGRSRLYDPTHSHLFRPETARRRRATAGQSTEPTAARPTPRPLPGKEGEQVIENMEDRSLGGTDEPHERSTGA
jgi:cobalt-precorrin 5A hydrolase / cobalt-factor III methyltransferase / precorrin-3B C17-methyltransferase